MIVMDAFIRFSGISLMMLLAIIALRDYRDWRSTPYLILTCFSVSAAFLGFAPSELRLNGVPFIIVRLADTPHLVFLWLFGLSLFDSDFRLKMQHIIIGLTYSGFMITSRLYDFNVSTPPIWLSPLISFLSICLVIHLCAITLSGRWDDLSKRRRGSRIYFIGIIFFVTVIAALSEALSTPKLIPAETLKILIIWPAIVWGSYWMVSFNKTAVTFSEQDLSSPKLNEKDKQLRDKLDDFIINQEGFRDDTLTIVTLSSAIGVSQHRLRSLINQSLGHTNFSAYINGHRINAVKAALCDPKKDHVPILTIAMEAGFKSLSPFNTAFKKFEGVTPTEWRKQHRT